MLSDREVGRFVRVCLRVDEKGGDASEPERDEAADAWGALYQHYFPLVAGFCRRTLVGEDGEDLANEILLKARFRLATFDPTRRFSPWLFQVAANRCWDEARRRRRSEPLDDEREQLPSGEPDPLELLITNEDRRRVQEALTRLPLRQRLALGLRYAGGLNYREIAESLGVTPGNVGVILLRGRRRLRRVLAESSGRMSLNTES